MVKIMAANKFKCSVCGYVHEGDQAPDKCPQCFAPKEAFEKIEEGAPAKKGIDTNSNAYTIIYAAVMVIIVAFLLVFVSSSLKERQTNNVIQDTKSQILSSLNVNSVDVARAYDDFIKMDWLMNSNGTLVKNEEPFSTSYKEEFNAGRLHVFQADVDGDTKYIIPMNGLGLWGAIWGYIALNDDKSTVYGVYFSHASETPGLGGEIATDYFQKRFEGKTVVEDGKIVLNVTKYGTVKNADVQVDGVSGATITSTGVNSMIATVLEKYEPFLLSK